MRYLRALEASILRFTSNVRCVLSGKLGHRWQLFVNLISMRMGCLFHLNWLRVLAFFHLCPLELHQVLKLNHDSNESLALRL